MFSRTVNKGLFFFLIDLYKNKKKMKTKKKTKKEIKLNAEIKRRNAKFKKMSAAQKRVAIAEDVLVQLNKNKYQAERGVYCDVNVKSFIPANRFNLGEDDSFKKVELQPLLLDGTIESCEVCAIGSIFMSRVALGNEFKVDASRGYFNEEEADIDTSDLDSAVTAIKALKGIFTERQLRYIEFVFEGRNIGGMFDNESRAFKDKVYDFHAQYDTDDERLRAIMLNIIRNKGNFKI